MSEGVSEGNATPSGPNEPGAQKDRATNELSWRGRTVWCHSLTYLKYTLTIISSHQVIPVHRYYNQSSPANCGLEPPLQSVSLQCISLRYARIPNETVAKYLPRCVRRPHQWVIWTVLLKYLIPVTPEAFDIRISFTYFVIPHLDLKTRQPLGKWAPSKLTATRKGTPAPKMYCPCSRYAGMVKLTGKP